MPGPPRAGRRLERHRERIVPHRRRVVVAEVVEHFLEADRVGRRDLAVVEKPTHERVARRVDVDREGRKGLFFVSRIAEGVLDELSVALRARRGSAKCEPIDIPLLKPLFVARFLRFGMQARGHRGRAKPHRPGGSRGLAGRAGLSVGEPIGHHAPLQAAPPAPRRRLAIHAERAPPRAAPGAISELVEVDSLLPLGFLQLLAFLHPLARHHGRRRSSRSRNSSSRRRRGGALLGSQPGDAVRRACLRAKLVGRRFGQSVSLGERFRFRHRCIAEGDRFAEHLLGRLRSHGQFFGHHACRLDRRPRVTHRRARRIEGDDEREHRRGRGAGGDEHRDSRQRAA